MRKIAFERQQRRDQTTDCTESGPSLSRLFCRLGSESGEPDRHWRNTCVTAEQVEETSGRLHFSLSVLEGKQSSRSVSVKRLR